ncbi:class I SAM-dependent methyltransferase [Micromonospora sp. NPDC049559]|uniref:class I SAM-dependent methyltransferase n=1 Tax=Micromonospora sp. NPDC049559 TaxID=3155923 RepID=UPI003440FBC3
MTSRGFFDEHPRFLGTSATGASRKRLNGRYRGLVARQAEVLRGARVLDIASHDGRWSLAAIRAGAARVTGIEVREPLVGRAVAAMAEYGVSADRYEFLLGDAHEVLTRLRPGQFETILCLGFLYHTARHLALLSAMSRLRPRHLIVDTDVAPDDDPVIRLGLESTDDEGHSAGDGAAAMVGVPSRAALELMLRHVGYGSIGYVDWHGFTEDWDQLSDYRDGRRVSLRAGPT